MRPFIEGALAGALFFCSALAGAGEISVNPIRIELGPGQRTGTLTITNNGDKPTVLQATVKQWRQSDGGPVYEPTQDVIATPVLFRVAPRSRQLVRVGFTNPPASPASELSYRVYLTEVPEDKPGESQVRFLLQLGVPMFVAPSTTHDGLDWRISRQADGKLRLTAENRGNRHVRVQNLRLEDGRGSLLEQQELVYLLAGGRHEWLLKPQRTPEGGAMRLKIQSGRGPLEVNLDLDTR
jgi:fimbrial chaperone protein